MPLFRIQFIFSLIIILNGCQTNSVSVEEAKKITAEFNQSSFIAPPRTINDITFKLLEPESRPTENLAKHCNGKERDGKWVSRFKDYITRYKPNDIINTEVDSVAGWKFKYGWELYRGVSISELSRGNLAEAEKYQKQYLNIIPKKRTGTFTSAYSHLALIQTARGDLLSASDSLDNARQFMSLSNYVYPINSAWLAYTEGSYAMAKGEFKTAEKFLRESLKQYITSKYGPYSVVIALIRSELVKSIAAQGKLLEAESEARLAIAHNIEYNHVDMIRAAPVYFRFAKVLLDQGRINEAEKIASAAVWIYQNKCSPDDSIEFSESRRTLAEILAQQGRYDEALSLYEIIKQSLGKDTLIYRNHYDHDLTFSYALIHQGKINVARDRLKKTVDHFQHHYKLEHPLVAEAKGFLAIAEWNNNNKLARQLFDESLAVLMKPQQRTGVRPHNLRLIIETYLEFMSEQAKKDPTVANELFVLSEGLRNSTVQESILAMGARVAVNTPELASLLHKEQNARTKITALESTLNNAISEGVQSKSLQESISRLRLAQKTLFKEIINQFPEYANLINPAPVDIVNIQQLLSDDETFISIYSSSNKTYVWTAVKNQPLHFSVVPLGKKQMQQSVDTLRKAFIVSGDTMGSISDFNVSKAYQLYQEILEPSRSIWSHKTILLVVAHGPLGHLPLAVLPTERTEKTAIRSPLFIRYRNIPYLVKTHAIANFPSANAFKVLRSMKQPSNQRKPFIGFGDPWFNQEQAREAVMQKQTTEVATQSSVDFRSLADTSSFSSADISVLPRLPETADELFGIAQALGVNDESDIYLGKQANEKSVKSADLKSYETIVFATHGLVPGDINGLTQPALALSAPDVTDIKGDGLLTMDEIMNLNLNADWVVLSACNTGSSDGSDAEAVSGLGRAFFYAGARSLLVSNWPVETNSALLLTTGIFKSSKSSSNRAVALQKSMINLIEEGEFRNTQTGQTVFSYAHPIFWAPFSLVGDR